MPGGEAPSEPPLRIVPIGTVIPEVVHQAGLSRSAPGEFLLYLITAGLLPDPWAQALDQCHEIAPG